jgi:hypothetical protein
MLSGELITIAETVKCRLLPLENEKMRSSFRTERLRSRFVFITAFAALLGGCDSNEQSSTPAATPTTAQTSPGPPAVADQSEDSITDWCAAEPAFAENCDCGVERPSWTASQAQNAGHPVRKIVRRNDSGRIVEIDVEDRFMPQNGDVLSGFANIHKYFPTVEDCKAALPSHKR